MTHLSAYSWGAGGAEFKRLRATAGQGPNYVGPSCGYMLAYVGVYWPILRATWAHLVAMFASGWPMLSQKIQKMGAEKNVVKRRIFGWSESYLGAMLAHLGAMLAHLEGNVGPSWGYVGPSWGYVGPFWGYVGPSWRHVGPS